MDARVRPVPPLTSLDYYYIPFTFRQANDAKLSQHYSGAYVNAFIIITIVATFS